MCQQLITNFYQPGAINLGAAGSQNLCQLSKHRPQQLLSTGTRAGAPERCSPPAPRHLQPHSRAPPAPRPPALLLPIWQLYGARHRSSEKHPQSNGHSARTSFGASQGLLISQVSGAAETVRQTHVPTPQPSYVQRGGHELGDALSLQGLHHHRVPHRPLNMGWDPLGMKRLKVISALQQRTPQL